MTATNYASAVTALINDIGGPDFEFPFHFENDVRVCFERRMSVEAAAVKLHDEYTQAV